MCAAGRSMTPNTQEHSWKYAGTINPQREPEKTNKKKVLFWMDTENIKYLPSALSEFYSGIS